ncbi:hypothetical protein ABT065_27245 [Streptomyces sp. NPDC002764]|uniref:hypothetical protein n=1 Tax=Streptomyces sp. NPDC002764 TaxID=3154428 RepID=UPI00332AF1E2
MSPRSRVSATLVALATVGLLGTASPAMAAPQVPKAPASASAFNFTTVIDQWTHWSPDPYYSTHAGTLYKGTSYFYCWDYGVQYSNNGHTSIIWFKTDDDTGNRNVWVSKVNFDDWGWYNSEDKLRKC